jgi:hypothetical protein
MSNASDVLKINARDVQQWDDQVNSGEIAYMLPGTAMVAVHASKMLPQ